VQQWVPYSRISGSLKRAVSVAEDDAVWQHEGIDVKQIKESIERDLQKRSFSRGGSTITQQLAKNLYLSPSKNPVRKLRELLITRRLEASLTKTRIFEIYLNVIEWGDRIYGAEAASRTHFRKPASALDARRPPCSPEHHEPADLEPGPPDAGGSQEAEGSSVAWGWSRRRPTRPPGNAEISTPAIPGRADRTCMPSQDPHRQRWPRGVSAVGCFRGRPRRERPARIAGSLSAAPRAARQVPSPAARTPSTPLRFRANGRARTGRRRRRCRRRDRAVDGEEHEVARGGRDGRRGRRRLPVRRARGAARQPGRRRTA
jgi:hypothetical protein